ncbi:uncharacterized protein STEHIDRAFT_160732 [Stereum hirsutum FP-91666 SS1]|uniref:uncharacterized protein n=1 Tax=Stereum hirsutum (strain FP-91666) TaxID=721885 RepID=UPI0004449B1F|nr:uncharacterized protein STEHIDRAFT_160732 [Stereum hirsutum FP-91666 SS1]EIM83133.1 hypothetical protein STEHIDRAFT_160732 [Stereum hirsutum FP-91666 SS1]
MPSPSPHAPSPASIPSAPAISTPNALTGALSVNTRIRVSALPLRAPPLPLRTPPPQPQSPPHPPSPPPTHLRAPSPCVRPLRAPSSRIHVSACPSTLHIHISAYPRIARPLRVYASSTYPRAVSASPSTSSTSIRLRSLPLPPSSRLCTRPPATRSRAPPQDPQAPFWTEPTEFEHRNNVSRLRSTLYPWLVSNLLSSEIMSNVPSSPFPSLYDSNNWAVWSRAITKVDPTSSSEVKTLHRLSQKKLKPELFVYFKRASPTSPLTPCHPGEEVELKKRHHTAVNEPHIGQATICLWQSLSKREAQAKKQSKAKKLRAEDVAEEDFELAMVESDDEMEDWEFYGEEAPEESMFVASKEPTPPSLSSSLPTPLLSTFAIPLPLHPILPAETNILSVNTSYAASLPSREQAYM